MEWNESNSNLNFERRSRRNPYRAIATGVAVVIFSLIWKLLPAVTLYWLLLLLIGALVWIASYGWREALAALITYLVRLEKL